MAFSIGDSVTCRDFGDGFLAQLTGGPDGEPIAHVMQQGPMRRHSSYAVRISELSAGPALPEFAVGAKLPLYGGFGEIIARNGSTYHARVTRPRRSGLVLVNEYPAVPAFHLALQF